MDKISPEKRSWNMSRIRGADTQPELKVRKFLFSQGFRYRIHYPIAGKPDIVFTKHRIALFVHGCFWHRHGCRYSVMPKSNTGYWGDKLQRNVERDRSVATQLEQEGYQVFAVWECEIESAFEETMDRLVQFIKPRNRSNKKGKG